MTEPTATNAPAAPDPAPAGTPCGNCGALLRCWASAWRTVAIASCAISIRTLAASTRSAGDEPASE